MKTEQNNKGDRKNKGKLKWSLVDFSSFEDMVKVLEFGAEKYAPNNWKKGLPITEICESMLRHIYAYLSGENNDSESGLSHIGHIQCNAMFLSFMDKNRKDLDDRFSEIKEQSIIKKSKSIERRKYKKLEPETKSALIKDSLKISAKTLSKKYDVPLRTVYRLLKNK